MDQYATFLCPSGSNACCSALVVNKLLHSHYRSKHKELIISNFEIPIPQGGTTLGYLIIMDEKLFIVKLNQQLLLDDSRGRYDLKVALSVHFVGNTHEKQTFVYQLQLWDNRSLKYDYLPYIVNRGLNSSSHSMSFTINLNRNNKTIVDGVFITYYKLKVTTRELYAINEAMSSQITCPSCRKLMTRPIYVCTEGHSNCHKCLTNPITNNDNTYSEFDDTAYDYDEENHCTFEDCDAPVLSTRCSLAEYQSEIISNIGPRTNNERICPVKSCTWTSNVAQLYDHVMQLHKTSLLSAFPFRRPLTFSDGNVNAVYQSSDFLHFDNNLFRLVYEYKGQVLQWAVQLIGPCTDYGCYKFGVKLIGRNGGNNQFDLEWMCLPYTDVSEVSSWISCSLDQVLGFVDEKLGFEYELKMVKA